MQLRQRKILFLIVFAQFACTSVWFAVNAVMPQLAEAYQINVNSLGFFTAVIQFGFITGTLIFAFLSLADRFKSSKTFMICALLSGLSNLSLLHPHNSYWSITILRFITGICLAGIYPIGIKIASDFFKNGLGRALGFLVGTLVLGTAIPHFFNFIAFENSLQFVIGLTSGLSFLGALLIGLGVPQGPFSKTGSKFQPKIIFKLLSNIPLRRASFGYFGHMWELYTFWAFTPLLLTTYNQTNNVEINISLWSFIIIVSGFFSCIVGGFLAQIKSSQYVAKLSLWISLSCILLFPLALKMSPFLFLFFMIVWGMFVIADSPQLSTLVAQSAPINYKGTAITLVNSLGFLLTIFSIQIMNSYTINLGSNTPFLILAIGPVFGLYFLSKKIIGIL